MDDVAGDPGGAAHGDHGPDGGQLHARGPRLQERGVQVRVTAEVVRMGPALVMTLNQSQSQLTLIRIRDFSLTLTLTIVDTGLQCPVLLF